MIDKTIHLVPQKLQATDYTEDDLNMSPDGFFTTISAVDILEVSPSDDILDKICNKLRTGGILQLSGIDGLALCRGVYAGDINLAQYSNIIKNLKRVYSVISLKKYFTDRHWKIEFAGLHQNKYNVKIRKP